MYLGGALSIQNPLELSEGEGSYRSGEVKEAQSSVLGGSVTCFWGGVSGESRSSGLVSPYAVLNGDDLIVVQAVHCHGESEFGNELCVN